MLKNWAAQASSKTFLAASVATILSLNATLSKLPLARFARPRNALRPTKSEPTPLVSMPKARPHGSMA